MARAFPSILPTFSRCMAGAALRWLTAEHTGVLGGLLGARSSGGNGEGRWKRCLASGSCCLANGWVERQGGLKSHLADCINPGSDSGDWCTVLSSLPAWVSPWSAAPGPADPNLGANDLVQSPRVTGKGTVPREILRSVFKITF